jgi:hypothetical protein
MYALKLSSHKLRVCVRARSCEVGVGVAVTECKRDCRHQAVKVGVGGLVAETDDGGHHATHACAKTHTSEQEDFYVSSISSSRFQCVERGCIRECVCIRRRLGTRRAKSASVL